MVADGTELLSYLKRIAEAGERIADHLTKQAMKPVAGAEVPGFYNSQPEQSHGESQPRHQRPRQASRS
jgi:hypothetical protein